MRDKFLVTGATRGIGRAISDKLIDSGNDLLIVWRESKHEAEQLVSRARRNGVSVKSFRCDLRDEAETLELARRLAREGPLSGVVNCATNPVVFESISSATYTTWHDAFAINLFSPLILLRELSGNLLRGGSVINVSSPNVDIGQEGMSAYVSAKAALEAFSRVLAREIGERQIRVNVIRPGPTLTDGLTSALSTADELEQLREIAPFGDVASPEHIADVVVAMCSNNFRWVTGQSITVSGGLL